MPPASFSALASVRIQHLDRVERRIDRPVARGLGGVLGGVMLQHMGISAVFAAAAALIILWLPLLLWGRSRVVAADAAVAA
jgi:hypothetical protein